MQVIPLFLVGAVSVAVLSGCSQGRGSVVNTASVPAAAPVVSTPVPSPSVSTPVIPTTGSNVLPGAQVPVLPPEAKAHNELGAFAFAASMAPALDWAYSTANSAILRPLYATTCEGCQASVRHFDAAHAAGDRWIGGHVTLKAATPMLHVRAGVKAEYTVKVTLHQTGVKFVDRNGKAIGTQELTTGIATIEYSMAWFTDRWLIVDWTYVVSPK